MRKINAFDLEYHALKAPGFFHPSSSSHPRDSGSQCGICECGRMAAWPGVQFEDAISASQITGGADRGEMGSAVAAVGLTVGWVAGLGAVTGDKGVM